MRAAREGKQKRIDEIVGRLARRYSTAAVLFHHAVAERLGLGPTDHKCLDLLRERGSMIGSELAAITGLTSGAITGVVARLEEAGYLRREPDPNDGRQQILYPKTEQVGNIQEVFGPIRRDVAALLEDFDAHQLTAIAEFLARSTEFTYTHMGVLRAQTFCAGSQTTATAKADQPPPVKGRSRLQAAPAAAHTRSKTRIVKVQR